MLTIKDIEKILYSEEGFKHVSDIVTTQYLRVITESYCFFIFNNLDFVYYVDYNTLTKCEGTEPISSCCYKLDIKKHILDGKIKNVIYDKDIETELGNMVVVSNILKVMVKLSTMNRKHKLERFL